MDLVGLARAARSSRDYCELHVCADWLEQKGDPARGALVHLQCELAELEPYDRRYAEIEWDVAALVAVHGDRWREALPHLPGIEWLGFELGCIAGARVPDLARLCKHALAIAAAGLVTRIELGSGIGELVKGTDLEFITTLRASTAHGHALVLGTRLELDTNTSPEITRKRPLHELVITGSTEIGRELVDALLVAQWARHLTVLEVPTTHESDNSGYYEDPTIGVEGAANLARLTSLERLTIDRQRVTSAGLKRIFAGLPNLRAFSGRECGSGKPALGKGAPLVELDLSRNALGATGVIALAKEPRAHALGKLVLDTCEVESLGVSALVASPMWSTLRTLDLSRNPLGVGGMRTLVAAPAPAQLHTLNIADCDLEEQSHAVLAKIPWLGQLLVLDLSGNTLGQGAAALRAIPADRLRHLAMASTGMVRTDAAALAKFWPHLVVLELGNNPLGAAALERFAVTREANRLQTLDLSNCSLDDDGLDMIGAARAPHLLGLKLAGNAFGPALLAFLKMTVAQRLVHLDLSRCMLAPDLIARLAAALPPQLRSLDLRGNGLTRDLLIALAREPKLHGVKLLLDGEHWKFAAEDRDELIKRFGANWFEPSP